MPSNVPLLEEAAAKLKHLLPEVIFVGGAVLDLRDEQFLELQLGPPMAKVTILLCCYQPCRSPCFKTYLFSCLNVFRILFGSMLDYPACICTKHGW